MRVNDIIGCGPRSRSSACILSGSRVGAASIAAQGAMLAGDCLGTSGTTEGGSRWEHGGLRLGHGTALASSSVISATIPHSSSFGPLTVDHHRPKEGMTFRQAFELGSESHSVL